MSESAAVSPADAVGTWGDSAPGQPQLVLARDGSLTGTDGCNRLAGRWADTGGAVAFAEVISTLMFCEDVDTWLSGLRAGTIVGDTMLVHNADGAQIGALHKQAG